MVLNLGEAPLWKLVGTKLNTARDRGLEVAVGGWGGAGVRRKAQLRDNLFGLLVLGIARVCQHGGHMLRLGRRFSFSHWGTNCLAKDPESTENTV